MKYRVFILPFNKDQELIGTGFMGVEVASYQDIKDAIREYACNKDGHYKSEFIKIDFSLASTVDAAKAEGDKQAKENGIVNLFQICSMMQNDPFKDIHIFFRPGRWLDNEKKPFSFFIDSPQKSYPHYGKFSEVLKELGIELD